VKGIYRVSTAGENKQINEEESNKENKNKKPLSLLSS
jgi:hypothetical protein